MAEHVCSGCSIRFERPGDRPYKYCSTPCYHAATVGVPRPRASLVERECRQCGDQFSSKRSAGARTHYCSRSCQGYAAAGIDVRQLTLAEAAYLAGLIDGEGSVFIIDRRSSRPGSSRPTIILSIVGTYMPMHEWLVRVTGVGKPRKSGPTPGTTQSHGFNTNRQCYTWRVVSTAALGVLEQTVPHMIEKRARAELALQSRHSYEALDGSLGSFD